MIPSVTKPKSAGLAKKVRSDAPRAALHRAVADHKRKKYKKPKSVTLPQQLTQQGMNLQEPKEIFEACARLYGRGMTRAQIAKGLVDHLVPADTKARNLEQKLHHARKKLRAWEKRKDFRDLVYANAVEGLDLALPEILQGVGKLAKKGRVDAARLALEVTGRHTKDDQPPTQVTVNIANIPRPQ